MQILNKVTKALSNIPHPFWTMVIIVVTFFSYIGVSTVRNNFSNLKKQNEQLTATIATNTLNTVTLDKKIVAEQHSKIENYIRIINDKLPEILIKEITTVVIKKCKEHNVQISLILSIIKKESTFDPMAKSSKNCRGLMQIDPDIWLKEFNILNISDLHEIDINIDTGIQILKHYLEQSTTYEKALARYSGNARNYADKVFKGMAKIIIFLNKKN